MLKHFMRSGVAPLKLAIVLAVGVAARAAVPYLPLVGPPSLRVEPPQHISTESASLVIGGSNQVKTNALVADSGTNAIAKSVSSTTSNLTTVASAKDKAEMTTSDSGPAESNQSLGDTFTTSVFSLPTPDLLGITPQALSAYFRPVHLGTNAPIMGPFPLSFIPPMPPDKSSHAEYILK